MVLAKGTKTVFRLKPKKFHAWANVFAIDSSVWITNKSLNG